MGASALGPEDRRNQVPAGSKTRHGESLDDDFSVDEAPISGFREDSEKSRDAHSHAFRLASRFPVVDETQGRKLGSKADRLSLTPTECEASATRFGTSNLEPTRMGRNPGPDGIRRARGLKLLDDRWRDHDPTEDGGKDFHLLDQHEVIQR